MVPSSSSPSSATQTGSTTCCLEDCCVCKAEGPVATEFNNTSWTSILKLVLAVLHHSSKESGQDYFSNHVITHFVKSHWTKICGSKKWTNDWKSRISDCLSHNPKSFESQERGKWRLKNRAHVKEVVQRLREISQSHGRGPHASSHSHTSSSSSSSHTPLAPRPKRQRASSEDSNSSSSPASSPMSSPLSVPSFSPKRQRVNIKGELDFCPPLRLSTPESDSPRDYAQSSPESSYCPSPSPPLAVPSPSNYSSSPYSTPLRTPSPNIPLAAHHLLALSGSCPPPLAQSADSLTHFPPSSPLNHYASSSSSPSPRLSVSDSIFPPMSHPFLPPPSSPGPAFFHTVNNQISESRWEYYRFTMDRGMVDLFNKRGSQ